MKRLSIQIQPARSPGLDVPEVIARLSHLPVEAQFSKGDDESKYLDFHYETGDLAGFWVLVREELAAIPGLAEATIVVCEGSSGWDDYLLLHHFDATEPLDECR